MTTGEKIRQQRKFLDMKQEELSKLIGVSLKTVQRWEAGERSPRVEEMSRLSDALHVSAGYLMGLEESPERSETGADVPSIKENMTHETNTNMATITLDNGKKIEAPATPEGFAFLKELFAMSLAGTAAAV